ncbi:hypothetical protein KQI84_08585 [bacterium]|nr:hypothetical protein [bacterium]
MLLEITTHQYQVRCRRCSRNYWGEIGPDAYEGFLLLDEHYVPAGCWRLDDWLWEDLRVLIQGYEGIHPERMLQLEWIQETKRGVQRDLLLGMVLAAESHHPGYRLHCLPPCPNCGEYAVYYMVTGHIKRNLQQLTADSWRKRTDADRQTVAFGYLDYLHDHPPLDHVDVLTVPPVTLYESMIGNMDGLKRGEILERLLKHFARLGMEPPRIADDDFEVPDYRF